LEIQSIIERIGNSPIIAAVGETENVQKAIESPCDVVFLLFGDVFNLQKIVSTLLEARKIVFVHLDLIKGITHDATGLNYLKSFVNPHGIITTKTTIVKQAKDIGFFTIQRLFLLDSKSLDAGINSLHETKPHAIEVLPGVIPKVTRRICGITKAPVIAGGLIDQKSEIIEMLNAGVIAISTSDYKLWDA
jgi:glycerol uptake operon antiterminator